MAVNGNGLNTKQKVFIEEYLKCWNATKAARRAGYSEKYLHTNASKLLQNTTIKAQIQARIDELKMSTDEILVRLAHQARGDIGKFATIENSEDLAEHPQSYIVKKFKKRVYTPRDENEDPYEDIELELYDAHAPLVDLGRAKGIFTDRVEHTGKDGGPIEFKEAIVEIEDDQVD